MKRQRQTTIYAPVPTYSLPICVKFNALIAHCTDFGPMIFQRPGPIIVSGRKKRVKRVPYGLERPKWEVIWSVDVPG